MRRTSTYYYLFKYDPRNEENPIPEMTGSDLKRTGTRQDFDTTTNEPVVLMQFTGGGAKKFEDITQTLVERGRNLANQQGLPGGAGNDDANQQFAIVLDREMKSAPSVDFDDNPNGIPGNNGAQITGISISDAKDLALVLQSGTLPFKLITIEQTDISATLGKDSLQEAKKAAIGGLILVAIFLLLFYRFLGLVAVIGLGIYAAFLYAAVLLFNVTLTLPGFAGLILTIGVAADANVVVFERIKEEVRAGKSVRAAIAAGYSKGFHTIIDANVVTAITALVLFLVATAGVKGFALMLLIGTIDLAGHGGRRDAGDARPARRASAGSTTPASWAPRASRARSGSRSTSCDGAISGLRAPARSCWSPSEHWASGASTWASTSRAARRSRSTHRSHSSSRTCETMRRASTRASQRRSSRDAAR